ncbi:hypothetical protein [Bailinhaonella thermotolerans]|uniref:Integral membrane protein n=1 Tax=Bailinhaonella thermotolerans TaxID=1070861 RepID=A0A3A4AZN5_9ACTN|nr:hypothetical protein [Bailinhaonella thermotolerans]RJL34049.1 hypothetical protein D5H75_05955 [Bailinhaonella thermotolerans]
MDGFVDTSPDGVTELRVHGVAGAGPADILRHPRPARVSGDRHAGFYRRRWPSDPPAGDDDPDRPGRWHREAYAWGALTSARASRALWLLLLPFTLVNLAYFMAPRPPDGRLRGVRRAGEAAQRLFALIVTGMLISSAVTAAVDLVGWQCARPGGPCAANQFLGWLSELPDSRRVAVTALVPVAVIAALWALAARTWRTGEGTEIPAHTPEAADRAPEPGPLLARRRLWNGLAPVGRLRSLHLAYGFAMIALAVAAPFAVVPPGTAPFSAEEMATRPPAVLAARAAVISALAVQALAAALVLAPATARRTEPGDERWWERRLTASCRALRWAGVAACATAIGAAAWGLPASGAERPARLPGLPALAGVDFWAAAGLLGVIALTTAALAAGSRGSGPRAMLGMGTWVTLFLAWGLAAAFSTGLAFWTADALGTPVFPGQRRPDGLEVSGPEWWSVVAMTAVAGLVALLAGWLAVRWRLDARRLRPALTSSYGGQAGRVARVWSAAGLTEHIGPVLFTAALAGVGSLVTVTALFHSDPSAPPDGWFGRLAMTGATITAAFAAGLLALGWFAYRNRSLRRTVGILWDVATFWPRATHPLAPPCYNERLVPCLIDRVQTLERTVLSGHSQGSVITASLVLQLDRPLRSRVSLITHGSPLRRLYAAFFPAYFGPSALAAVRDAVDGRWHNLYRLSDPIGGPVLHDRDPFAPTPVTDPVDRYLWDPAREPLPGGGRPPCHGHSSYFEDPVYRVSLRALGGLPGEAGPAVPSPRKPSTKEEQNVPRQVKATPPAPRRSAKSGSAPAGPRSGGRAAAEKDHAGPPEAEPAEDAEPRRSRAKAAATRSPAARTRATAQAAPEPAKPSKPAKPAKPSRKGGDAAPDPPEPQIPEPRGGDAAGAAGREPQAPAPEPPTPKTRAPAPERAAAKKPATRRTAEAGEKGRKPSARRTAASTATRGKKKQEEDTGTPTPEKPPTGPRDEPAAPRASDPSGNSPEKTGPRDPEPSASGAESEEAAGPRRATAERARRDPAGGAAGEDPATADAGPEPAGPEPEPPGAEPGEPDARAGAPTARPGGAEAKAAAGGEETGARDAATGAEDGGSDAAGTGRADAGGQPARKAAGARPRAAGGAAGEPEAAPSGGAGGETGEAARPRRATTKRAPEKAAPEKATAEKATAEKATAEKATAEKAAAEPGAGPAKGKAGAAKGKAGAARAKAGAAGAGVGADDVETGAEDAASGEGGAETGGSGRSRRTAAKRAPKAAAESRAAGEGAGTASAGKGGTARRRGGGREPGS